MARGRKKTKKVIKNSDVISSGTQQLNYQGKVTVRLLHGNQVVKTTKFKNKGLKPLFEFICKSLAGNYSESLRPTKIKLFYYKPAESVVLDVNSPGKVSNFNWETAFNTDDTDEKPNSLTPFILYDTTPKLYYNEKDAQYEITYHFRVPFSMISGSGNNGTTIHMVGLYTNGTYQGLERNAAAYYLFTDDKGQEWEPLVLDDIKGNYSIIIDWTLAIMNKPIKIDNTDSAQVL